MLQKKYLINFVVLGGSFAVLAFFSYSLVEHHVTLPERLDIARVSLLSSGQSVEQRIKPIGTVAEQEAPEAPAPVALAAPTLVKDGAQIFSQTCAACHMAGIAGAPKVGDKAQWQSRIAKGVDTLYGSALNGVQGQQAVMPAKGGNASLSELEVKAAVDYMVAQVR